MIYSEKSLEDEIKRTDKERNRERNNGNESRAIWLDGHYTALIMLLPTVRKLDDVCKSGNTTK